ncbi:MAG: DUF6602 domain-containing protein [Acidobacteriota bacterium]
MSTQGRKWKHEHGTRNPIILEEERIILAIVDRALASTTNSQVIGRNGELPARDFLNRYLPQTFRAATGHFVTPGGEISPQIDIMVLDSRYPLLADNPDGSVIAMAHGVVTCIEVKTRMTSKDVERGWQNSFEIVELVEGIPEYAASKSVGAGVIRTRGLAYRLAASLTAIGKAYDAAGLLHVTTWDVYILRLPEREQVPGKELGATLRLDPAGLEDDEGFIPHTPLIELSQTPLSDLYYSLVRDAYDCLAQRNWSHGDIARHVDQYMSLASYSWYDYERERGA